MEFAFLWAYASLRRLICAEWGEFPIPEARLRYSLAQKRKGRGGCVYCMGSQLN